MKLISAYLALPAPSRAMLLMTMSALSYAMTFASVRELSETFSVYQLVMFRAAIALPL